MKEVVYDLLNEFKQSEVGINNNLDLVKDLDIDEVEDIPYILCELEDHFSVRIPDEFDLNKLKTVGDLVQLFEELILVNQ